MSGTIELANAPDAAAMQLVCVIDDDSQMREMMAQVLRRAGFTVVAAGDGEAGVEAVETSGARVVVTDIFMPNRDGLEAICSLRKKFPDIRILAISGGPRLPSHTDFLDAATELGADDSLAKPFRAADLVAKVSDLIQRRPSQQQPPRIA
jgi:DNA-binding response OmpR family regulator